MSDENTQGRDAEAPPPKRKGKSRAVRWLAAGLVLSVSLNLLIVGFAATRAYSHWGKRWSGQTSIGHVMREGRRFVRGLPRERRRELIAIVKSRRSEFHADKAKVREAVRMFATALKQTSYEVTQVEEALNLLQGEADTMFTKGRSVTLEVIAALSAEERRAFADRLLKKVER